jgi:hypothetical protein
LRSKLVAERPCPLCQSIWRGKAPEVMAKYPAENLSSTELTELFVGFRADQSFFSYCRCLDCGQLFAPQYFSQAALNELYSSMPENTFVSGEVDSEKTQKGYIRHLGDTTGAKRYLEIGADIGLLASEFSRLNPNSSITSIEPNVGVHFEFLKRQVPGSTVFTEIEKVGPDAEFDVVTAIHVVDHLLNPLEYLQTIRNILSENSKLLIVVHNEKTALRRILSNSWPPFCLQHPQLFNQRSLSHMLNNSGLPSPTFAKTTNWMSVRQSAMLANSVGFLPQWSVGFFPNISVPLRLGNMAALSTISV